MECPSAAKAEIAMECLAHLSQVTCDTRLALVSPRYDNTLSILLVRLSSYAQSYLYYLSSSVVDICK